MKTIRSSYLRGSESLSGLALFTLINYQLQTHLLLQFRDYH